MTTQTAIEALELFAENDAQTMQGVGFAFRHASRTVDRAAADLARHRAQWHDDPEGDPEGHAEHHADWREQFPPEVRAAVVLALIELCERFRQENLLNERVS